MSSSTGFGGNRLLLFVSAVFGWSCCFLCQRTLPSAIGHMTSTTATKFSDNEDGNVPVFTKEEYGRLQNLFVAAYSVSILFSGFLSDYFNPRILFFVSMGMSGTLCAAFPLTTGNKTLCSFVWFLFGLFEGCGWPATAKMVKQMYTPSELGIWWSFLSSCSNLAASISPLFVSFVIKHSNWQTCFYITGSIPVLSFPMLALVIGSNSVTKSNMHNPSDVHTSRVHKWYQVFLSSTLWLIVAVYIILWVAKSSTNNWALLYLEEVCQQLPQKALAVSLMQFGGVLGKLAFGNLSTWLIQKDIMKRATLLCVTMSMVTLLMMAFGSSSFKDHNEIIILLVMFLIGFSIDGSIVLTNLATMETVPSSLTGSALGLATFLSQFVGRSLGAGYVFSHIQQSHGWTSVYQGVAMLCIAAATLCAYISIG